MTDMIPTRQEKVFPFSKPSRLLPFCNKFPNLTKKASLEDEGLHVLVGALVSAAQLLARCPKEGKLKLSLRNGSLPKGSTGGALDPRQLLTLSRAAL